MPIMSTDVPVAPAGPAAQSSTRRERVGWYFYDWANSALSTTVISVLLGPYLTSVGEKAAGCVTLPDDTVDCTGKMLHPLGIPVAPGSVFAYAVSLSVILQVVVLPVAGAIADR